MRLVASILGAFLGAFLGGLSLTVLGCSDPVKSLPPLDIPQGCNPLASEHDCLLPYPSDFFLVDDATMPSGKRVALTDSAKPVDKNEVPFDFMKHHPVDGFSHHQPIMAYFKSGVSTEGVLFHTDDPAKTILPESKVVLLDAATGTAIPVWAEIDMNSTEPSEQPFIIRPFQRLENGKRYIVALQGLLAADGTELTVPEGFRRIRDVQAGTDPVLAPIAGRYEKDIFPALAAFGMERKNLDLAWDFTTSTEESNTRDLLQIRDELIAEFEVTPPKVTIGKVVENTVAENENIWLRIEGTITVPLYLENDGLEAQLNRGPDGKLARNGTTEVPFTMQVPHSAMPVDAAFEPARIMHYGHGFFGSREEINYSFMRGYSNERGYITAAVDWLGMSEPDVEILIKRAFTDVSQVFRFIDRVHQGMANQLALSYAVKGPLAQAVELKRFDKLLYDPAKFYYYGISQGVTLGLTMVTLNPILDRAALGVGGSPYSLMMSRSASFQELYSIIGGQLQNPVALTKLIMLSQSTWDRVDSMTYAPHLLTNTFPKSPENRHVLMQIGIGDHSVNNLASHLMARSVGLPLLDPSPRPIWGLDSVMSPADDALVVVDFKLATEPGLICKVPAAAEKNGVHEDVRRNTKIKDQLDLFFQPNGMIQNTCDGPCDPE